MAGEIDLSQFHEVFFEEAFEGLDVMETGLLGLEPDSLNVETINNVFRAAHSIKGGAGTFGFSEISDFTHIVETMLDDLRSESIQLTENMVQILLESTDFLKRMLRAAQSSGSLSEAEIQEHTEKLINFNDEDTIPPALSDEALEAESQPEPETSLASAGDETCTLWKIRFEPHRNLFATGNDPYRILRELAELGDLRTKLDASALPDFGNLESDQCYLAWDLELSNSDVPESEIREVFEWVEDDAVIMITPEGATLATPEKEIAAPHKPEVASPRIEKKQEAQTPEVTSIRVNIDRVDMLVNLVGELVITQSMLSRFKDRDASIDVNDLIKGIEQLEENTRELQEQTMRIRMLPVDNVFQRMPRLVHDLSRSLGKQIDLELIGKSTEVDKTVLEKISDPLTHLVRNCLDHGIETPEDRVNVGKSEIGRVEISAYHEGGNIIIKVSDDGRGLNRKAILAKAIERGVIEADADLSDGQIHQLIFSPGFSTAEEISDVSGRGVGMDVVKNNIEQLNGHIDVESREGQGATFIIKLPLTLAIIEGQLVRVGTDVFIIPVLSVIKSTQVRDEDHNVVAGEASMFRLEDDYIPIVELKDIYRIRSDYEKISDGILVVIDGVERFGVLVDEVLGQQQVVVKSLESNFKAVPTISGATILGDGTVAMILDMPGLLRETKDVIKATV